MSGKYLLDTNAVIYAISRKLTLPLNRYAVSVITRLELLSWPALTDDDEQQLNRVLAMIPVIQLEQPIQDAAIKIRQTTSLKLPDSIISATAICHGLTLVTDDERLGSRHAGESVLFSDLVP